MFLLLVYRFWIAGVPHTQPESFPTFTNSKEHFIHTLRPFSRFLHARPDIITKDYFNCSGLQQIERELLTVFVRDYLSYHIANYRNKTARRLVFKPFRTGLGDTFGQFMLAYWTAVVTKRVFLIDWKRPFPLQDWFETADHRTEMFLQNEDEISKLGINGQIDKSSIVVLDGSEQSKTRFINIVESITRTVVFSMGSSPPRDTLIALVGRNLKNFQPREAVNFLGNVNCQRAVMHHIVRLNHEIRSEHIIHARAMGLRIPSDTSKSNWNPAALTWRQPRDTRGQGYVAVHARIGEGVGETTGRFQRVVKNLTIPARCLASRAVHISFMTGTPPPPVFLATDTPSFRAEFTRAVNEASHGRVSVLHGNWDVIHSSKLDFQMRNQKLSRENNTIEWNGIWASYMDLIMLGHAEHLIALQSSFPRLAFALGTAETFTELHSDICTVQEQWV